MNTLLISALLVIGGVAALVAVTWLAMQRAAAQAKADEQAAVALRNERTARAQGQIIAEYRTDDDTLGRMRDGSY